MDDPAKQPIYEGPTAEARLRALGIEQPGILTDAVIAGEIDRKSGSAYEPLTAPGFRSWASTFAYAAEALARYGWSKTERNGLPRVEHPERILAIAFCNGDYGVGLPSREPHSKNPRGLTTMKIVRSNLLRARQSSLFPVLGLPQQRPALVPPNSGRILTWWLLFYSGAHGALRAELSLPVGVEVDRRLSLWQERIILDFRKDTFAPKVEPDRGDSGDPQTDDNINIRRRR